MTEQLDGTPGFAASSYPSDDRLLAALREQWPPAQPLSDAGRGFIELDLAGTAPVAALRLADRYAVALTPEPAGSTLVVPLVRDDVLVTTFRHARPGDGLSAFVAGAPAASERAITADQTNTSVVVGERAIVKWFRRVGPGASRATTLLRHLDMVGFPEIPQPLGAIAWQSPIGVELTIAQGDAFLPGARDGWDWVVERLARHVAHGGAECPDSCEAWVGGSLGRLVARLHAALATRSPIVPDPVGVATPGAVSAWRETALRTLDAALEVEIDASDLVVDLGSRMRADVAGLGEDRAVQVQPVHGDLHVGQVLDWPGGLAVIDFDGNPAIGAEANAIRQPVERDLAQMLSSLDHVGRIVAQRTGGAAQSTIESWIGRTRRAFLEALDHQPDPILLAAFEVEQECRELIYAARFLPRWRYAPVATLRARYGR